MSDSTPPPINPYQAPVSAGELSSGALVGDCFRDGKFLVFRDGAELPMRCLINGEPVTADAWRKRKLITWNPPWVFLGLLVGGLLVLILILVFQKKGHITYSLGQKARSRMRNRYLLGTGLLVAFMVIVVAAISYPDPRIPAGVPVVSSFITFILGIVCLLTASPFKPAGHRNGWFRMKGVSQDLLDELPHRDWKSL